MNTRTSAEPVVTGSSGPFISCLCLTRDRANLLPMSIQCFLDQTYANKELVIVGHEEDAATRAVLDAHAHEPSIRHHLLEAGSQITFGGKRNLSVQLSRGEYFSVWDDDDWYHPQRLETQARALATYHKAACMLTNLLLWDEATGEAYFSQTRLWEGSLLCRRSAAAGSREYETVNLVEDSLFVNSLIQDGLVYPLPAPNLYVYRLHPRNNSGKKLRALMLEMAEKLSPENSKLIREVLSSKLSGADAQQLMNSPSLLASFNYFHGMHPTLPSKELAKLREYLAS